MNKEEMTAKLTDAERQILRSLADQPDGSCRTNWLPDDIDYTAYRECRDLGLLGESTGRGGFLVSAITPAGLAALEAKEGKADADVPR